MAIFFSAIWLASNIYSFIFTLKKSSGSNQVIWAQLFYCVSFSAAFLGSILARVKNKSLYGKIALWGMIAPAVLAISLLPGQLKQLSATFSIYQNTAPYIIYIQYGAFIVSYVAYAFVIYFFYRCTVAIKHIQALKQSA